MANQFVSIRKLVELRYLKSNGEVNIGFFKQYFKAKGD